MLTSSALRASKLVLRLLMRVTVGVCVFSACLCLSVAVAHATLRAGRGCELWVGQVAWWSCRNTAVEAVTQIAARSWWREISVLGRGQISLSVVVKVVVWWQRLGQRLWCGHGCSAHLKCWWNNIRKFVPSCGIFGRVCRAVDADAVVRFVIRCQALPTIQRTIQQLRPDAEARRVLDETEKRNRLFSVVWMGVDEGVVSGMPTC